MSEVTTITADEIREAIHGILEAAASDLAETENVVVVGIANGGIALSQILAEGLSARLNRPLRSGVIDITFHRDDIGLQPITKITIPTDLPFSVDDTTVLLVDDVLESGRTIRAAINELFDQGRPEAVRLAVLFDRLARRLPIVPDYTGFRRSVPPATQVRLVLDTNRMEEAEIRLE